MVENKREWVHLAIILISCAIILHYIYVRVQNPALTETQLFLKIGPIYLLPIVLSFAVYVIDSLYDRGSS